MKPYITFDVSWKAQWQQWQFQASIKNLFDHPAHGALLGEPRRVYLQVAYAI